MDKNTRIAIVDHNKCKPTKCAQECKRGCPVEKIGKLCIDVTKTSTTATIHETMCIGCGICVKKCPFHAITIVNIPSNLTKDVVFRYDSNSFKLHRLPIPRLGRVLGLIGINGIGKSTVLNILSGKEKPNMGIFNHPPTWEEILLYLRGSELQSFFKSLVEDKLKPVIKPQHVDRIVKDKKILSENKTVNEILIKIMEEERNEDSIKIDYVKNTFDLNKIQDRKVTLLSGGELQRFACAVTCIKNADIYMFDEPSSYLDIKQRILCARAIRNLSAPNNYIIVVEHDLCILDYVSDYICCLYGQPGAYGVVTKPFNTHQGINVFLDGFIPTENLRFREESLTFKINEKYGDELQHQYTQYTYPESFIKEGEFELTVEAGNFSDSEIIVLLGENGTGKTTFIQLLAGIKKPNIGSAFIPLIVSYKPQIIINGFDGTVREFLQSTIIRMYSTRLFVNTVIKPLQVERLYDKYIKHLSGGELQRIAIIVCLGTPADLYLIDEPSAYLDCEQRIIVSKVIKRYLVNMQKSVFIVEHDFIMATYLADKVIIFQGEPAIKAVASTPQKLVTGMNTFLKSLNVTFSRDPVNYRPRINKPNGIKDVEQKRSGNYFFVGD